MSAIISGARNTAVNNIGKIFFPQNILSSLFCWRETIDKICKLIMEYVVG